MLDNKKVIIFGDGQLGKALHNQLGQENTVLLTRKNIDFSDIKNFNFNLHALLDGVNILCIINCVAYTNVEKAETQEKELASIINGKSMEIIGLYCNARDIPLIHFSSDFVFDGTKDEPYTEDDAPNPINEYGASKLLGENILTSVHDKVLIFRIAWVYSISFNHNFVVKVLLAMSKNENINIPDDQLGNLCNVFDLARVIHKIVQKIAEHEKNEMEWGIYHISPLGFDSRFGIAKKILHTAKVTGYEDFLKIKQISPIATSLLNSPVARPLNSRLNSRKFFNTFRIGMPDWCFSLHNATQKIIQRIQAEDAYQNS